MSIALDTTQLICLVTALWLLSRLLGPSLAFLGDSLAIRLRRRIAGSEQQ